MLVKKVLRGSDFYPGILTKIVMPSVCVTQGHVDLIDPGHRRQKVKKFKRSKNLHYFAYLHNWSLPSIVQLSMQVENVNIFKGTRIADLCDSGAGADLIDPGHLGLKATHPMRW